MTRNVLVIGILTALSEIGLSISLVPALGLAGAAISRVSVFSVGCAISLYYIRPYLMGTRTLGFLTKVVVSGGVPGVVVFVLSSTVSDRVLSLLPYTALGLLLFFGCARVLKLFTDEDKTFATHLLPSRKAWVVRFL